MWKDELVVVQLLGKWKDRWIGSEWVDDGDGARGWVGECVHRLMGGWMGR